MKLHNKLSIVYSLFKAKFFRVKIPLIVSWMITRRCNLMCKYCNNQPVLDSDDMDTDTIFWIIGQLRQLGTRIIVFTGGEPLLRKDIGKIINFCIKQDIIVALNSNGYFVKERIKEIKGITLLNLSLDGPPDINDRVRGKNSFNYAVEAAKIATSEGIKVRFTTVLNKMNINKKSIDYLLNVAKQFKTTVVFQPVVEELLRGEGFHSLTSSKEEYREAIDYIISQKKRGKPIGNSLTVLKYFKNYPSTKPVKCAGYYIYRRIDNKGNIAICGREKRNRAGNCLKDDFKKAVLEVEFVRCDRCWCASRLEINYLFLLHPEVIINTIRKLT